MKHYSESNLAILGSARNVSRYVERTYNSLRLATRNFRSRHFFIVESYSSDNTVKILEELSQQDEQFHFQSIPLLVDMPALSVRIAEARNHSAEMARNFGEHFDYVLVADLDSVNLDITRRGIESCWNHSNWDMMSANQPFAYYDTWAFRHPILSPGDCWRDFDTLSTFLGKSLAYKLAVENRVLKIPASSKPLPVDSAFGGLAIYKAETYFKFKYSGLDENNLEVCEHVTLHRQMKASNLSLYINPQMINISPVRQRFAPFLARMLSFSKRTLRKSGVREKH